MDDGSRGRDGVRGVASHTVLWELLRKRHLLPYRLFCQEYEKVAGELDKRLVRTFPAETTYKRWLSGRIAGLPRSEPRIVLEAMFPDYTVEQLFSPAPPSEPSNSEGSTVLRKLLRRRYLQTYQAFCAAYSKAASTIDKKLVHGYPAERQFYRWITGDMLGLPYPHHCAVLEAMFPGYTARQLFEPYGHDRSESGAPPSDKAQSSTSQSDDSRGGVGRIELPHVGNRWNLEAIVFDVRRITGEDLVTRRETLTGAAAIIAGTALTEPLLQWLQPLTDRQSKVSAGGSAFSAEEICALEELAQQFRKWNIGGNRALMRKAAIAQLDDMTDRLHDASAGPLTSRAWRLAAELAEITASISWDAGLQRSAQRYYMTAVQLAKLANDDNFAAAALAALARQCYDLGNPRDGLEIVQLAQYGTRRTATSRLRAMLATREAWSYAQQAEIQAFHRAVRLAEDHFSDGPSDDDGNSVRRFDKAELVGVIGARFRDLAQHEEKYARSAQGYIRQALELRHPSQPRNRAFDLIGLARAHLITSEPDYACELIHQAIPIAQPWITGRVGAKLLEFHKEAEHYAVDPTVRDTRDAIHGLTI